MKIVAVPLPHNAGGRPGSDDVTFQSQLIALLDLTDALGHGGGRLPAAETDHSRLHWGGTQRIAVTNPYCTYAYSR